MQAKDLNGWSKHCPRTLDHEDAALELSRVVGEEQPGLGEEVLIAGVLERLGIAPVEVEEVGGRVQLNAFLEDVLVEAQDHALVLARLQVRVLLYRAAADGGEDHVLDGGGGGRVPGLELDDEGVVVPAVAAG